MGTNRSFGVLARLGVAMMRIRRSAVVAVGLAAGLAVGLMPAATNNGADIFRAAVADDGSSSWWRVDWNTLVDRTVPIAEWALDTDANAATGAATWPAGAGVKSPGIERAIVVSGSGAWLVTD